MINCCRLPSAPEFCFRVPDNYVELLSMLPDYSSCVSGRLNYMDRSTNLLHAAPIKHDPYTPDSMDSPSPNAIMTASADLPDVDIDNINNLSTLHSVNPSNSTRRLDRAVSPALLKSKLELIVRNKKQEMETMDQEVTDIKRSPSDCCLHSWPNTEEQWTVRTNRCNSDVSWQRSHLLTEAWIQGKGQQGYHSFGEFVNRVSLGDSSSPNGVEGLSSDLIIPRISIINASNFESNESSVYLHEDKYSNYSENKLSVYSDGQTKSLSGEAFSSEKSDETYEKIHDESNRLSSNTKKIAIDENVYLRDINELLTSQDKNTCPMMVSTNVYRVGSKIDEDKMLEAKEQRFNEIIDTLQSMEENNSRNLCALVQNEAHDKSSIKDRNVIMEDPVNDQTSQVLKYARTEQIEVHFGENEADKLSERETKGAKTEQNTEEGLRTNEVEILRCDNKNETVITQQITRSNSIQSQDISDSTGNVKLKLKAYQVSERCKHNIAEKKSRCQKCCCIVS